jgi:hypothetical protein
MDEWVVNYLAEVPTLFWLAFSFERRGENKETKLFTALFSLLICRIVLLFHVGRST